MSLVIKVPIKDELLKELLENIPECLYSFYSLEADYNKSRFKLLDKETEKVHFIGIVKMRTGFKKISELIFSGKLKGLSLDDDWMTNSSAWDAYSIDAYIQCCVFGEVIYG